MQNDIFKKIEKIEKRLDKIEQGKHNSYFVWFLFVVLIIAIVFKWINPLISNIDNLIGNTNGTVELIKNDANVSNEILDKINHPIKNIDKFNPF